jgi:hypothetical protein
MDIDISVNQFCVLILFKNFRLSIAEYAAILSPIAQPARLRGA